MVFSSFVFLFIFIPVLFVIYFAVPARYREARNGVLLLFSLVFYAYGGIMFLPLMILSILINYTFGLLVSPERGAQARKISLIPSVVLNLGLLGYFKYAGFCRESEQDRFFNDSPNIVLPTGISFFTFQGMSYVIDVYRGDSVPEKNPLHVALYISLFPQLVAGPIVRYTTVANEIHERRESIEGFSKGGIRFCFGLAKKMILANSLRALADEVFALSVSDLTVSLSWLGAIAYMGQIYFYFSAYSDMAIGLGQMFGFHFLKNFNYQISQRALPNSDAAGISVSPRGSSTMSIFLWAEADAAKEGRP